MTPIKILHASDLHISMNEEVRSPVDKWSDLDKWDVSASGWRDKKAAWEEIWKSFLSGTTSASSYQSAILRSFAEFANKYCKKYDDDGRAVSGFIDAVVLTGDLATTGEEDDIKLVKAFLEAPANEDYPHTSGPGRDATLSALEVPVLYLPGNHDRLELVDEAAWTIAGLKKVPMFFKPGGKHFDTHLSDVGVNDFRSFPVQRAPVIKSPLPDGRTLSVYLFLADFTLRDFNDHDDWGGGWIGQGRAYDDVCDQLADQTIKLRNSLPADEIPAFIWAGHFPPKFPGVSDSLRFVQDFVFLNAAKRAQVDAVLTGHTHRQLIYRRPWGKFDIFCCGTSTQYEPTTNPEGRYADNDQKGNFIQILSIDEEGGLPRISVEPYKYMHTSNGYPGDDPIAPGMGLNDQLWKKIDQETVRYRRRLFFL